MVWAVSLLTTKLSPRRLTLAHPQPGILGLVGVGKLAPPSPSSAVPPGDSLREASPKAISGRTSYLRVRLAFHPYPQLIPQICNSGEFGPPRRVSFASAWPWIAHAVSGLLDATRPPYSDSVSLRLRTFSPLTQTLRRVTRRFIPQKARHHGPAETGPRSDCL